MNAHLLLAAILSGFAHAAESAKPNIILIPADDNGWADTTLYGHTEFYRTPNVERLAKRGMTFTRAFSASPLCSPTRSAILTGLSPAPTGITQPNCHLPEVRLEARPAKAAPPDQKNIQPDPVTRLKTDYPTLSKPACGSPIATILPIPKAAIPSPASPRACLVPRSSACKPRSIPNRRRSGLPTVATAGTPLAKRASLRRLPISTASRHGSPNTRPTRLPARTTRRWPCFM